MLLSMTFKAVSEKPSTSTEIRRRLRKIKFYLLFRSACTNFVAESLNKRVARRVM